MLLRVIGVVSVCTALAVAQPAKPKAPPPNAEPAAAVVQRHREVADDLKRVTEKTTVVSLGTGSSLIIAKDGSFKAGIEIRLAYDPSTTISDDVGEHVAAFSLGKAIERTTKLKVNAVGGYGTAFIKITAEQPDQLLAAMPKIVSALASTKAPTASDHSAALKHLEKAYTDLAANVQEDLGLPALVYTNAPPRDALAKPDLVKKIRATKVAAADSARKRWRAGYVAIAITGGFDDKGVATVEKLVRDGLKGWALTARPTRLPTPTHRGQTVRVEKTGMPKTKILFGQAIDAADERAALALDIACGFGGVIRQRLHAKLTPEKVRPIVMCTRTGKRVEVTIAISDIDDVARADKLVALVTDELPRIVADGPTAAHLEEAQIVLLRHLNPLDADRGGTARSLVEDPPLAERMAAADAILAIKRVDVAAALKAHFDPKAFAIVIGTP